MSRRTKLVLVASTMAMLTAPVLADSDDGNLHDLKRQIEALQARVAALEARQTFTAFMPDFAERFHVMHRAGEAGDWAVASHELAEMKRLGALSISLDPVNGKLMQEMMEPSFEALEDAVEHGNHQKFERALSQTINTCNACHAATGSAFIQVTLDTVDSLSIRHPHRFMERDVPGDHTHGPPPGRTSQGGMPHSSAAGTAPHDDTGKPKHQH